MKGKAALHGEPEREPIPPQPHSAGSGGYTVAPS